MNNPFEMTGSVKDYYTDELVAFSKDSFLSVSGLVKSEAESMQRKQPLRSNSRVYAPSLAWYAEKQLETVYADVLDRVEDAAGKVMEAVVTDVNRFLRSVGVEKHYSCSSVKDKVRNLVIGGDMYDDRRGLASRFISELSLVSEKLRHIVELGISKRLEFDEISGDIRAFLDPYTRPDSSFRIKYPQGVSDAFSGLKTLIVTTMTHVYQQTVLLVSEHCPFIQVFYWKTSGMHNVCPVCRERQNTDKYGYGKGMIPKDKVPMDHPNGRCTLIPYGFVPEGDVEGMVREFLEKGTGKLAEWLKSL